MKERTLKVLARVQAVRESAARRKLETRAREVSESKEQVDALSLEQGEVRREHAQPQAPMARHAERYAEVLARKEAETREELTRRMAEREEARQEFLRVLLKSDVIAKRAAELSRNSK